MDTTTLSIIIVSWNTSRILQQCLDSIYEQTKDIDFEVIVVDNASTDNSAEMIKARFPHVILIENSNNKGFAAANNRGMAVARGRYILLLNSDTVILGNAIVETVSFADIHPNTAVIGCKVLNPDRTDQSSCFMFPSLLNLAVAITGLTAVFPHSRIFDREQLTCRNLNNIQDVDVVAGCFMLVRRAAVKQTGLMDERYFMYAEETDWCYRFKKRGWKVIFAPLGRIIHLSGASTKKIPVQMWLQLQGSILLFFKKHKTKPAYLLACLLVALLFLTRLPYWSARTIITGNNRKAHAQKAGACLKGSLFALLGGQKLCNRT